MSAVAVVVAVAAAGRALSGRGRRCKWIMVHDGLRADAGDSSTVLDTRLSKCVRVLRSSKIQSSKVKVVCDSDCEKGKSSPEQARQVGRQVFEQSKAANLLVKELHIHTMGLPSLSLKSKQANSLVGVLLIISELPHCVINLIVYKAILHCACATTLQSRCPVSGH